MINTVLFASPKAGSSELAERFNERVNGRRVYFHGDVVSAIPCGPVQPACSGVLDGYLGTMVS